jgi:hypothetical protein
MLSASTSTVNPTPVIVRLDSRRGGNNYLASFSLLNLLGCAPKAKRERPRGSKDSVKALTIKSAETVTRPLLRNCANGGVQ